MQGTIVTLEQTQASIFTSLMTVEVDEGYPSIVTLNIDSTLIGIVYDGVGQMNPNTSGDQLLPQVGAEREYLKIARFIHRMMQTSMCHRMWGHQW